MIKRLTGPQLQRGVLLEVALLLLIMLTLLGATMARSQLGEERMAQNDNNRQLAMQSAEAALRYAENQLINNPANFNFAGNTQGAYTLTVPTTVPSTVAPTAPNATQNYNSPALNIAYAIAGNAALYQSPTFTVYQLPAVATPGQCGGSNCPQTTIYEITAYGFGADTAQWSVTLQSIFE